MILFGLESFVEPGKYLEARRGIGKEITVLLYIAPDSIPSVPMSPSMPEAFSYQVQFIFIKNIHSGNTG